MSCSGSSTFVCSRFLLNVKPIPGTVVKTVAKISEPASPVAQIVLLSGKVQWNSFLRPPLPQATPHQHAFTLRPVRMRSMFASGLAPAAGN